MNIGEYISSGILEQYVFGLCEEQEAKEVEQMMAEHPAVAAALLQIELDLEANAFKSGIAPSSNTPNPFNEAFFASQNIDTPAPVVSINKHRFVFRNIAAVLALALASSVFYNVIQFNKAKDQENIIASIKNIKSLPASDLAIMQNPYITPIAMRGQGIHEICRCTLFWDKETGKAYVMIHHLIPLGGSNDYQLWATVNGKPVSVGIINEKTRDRFVELSGVPGNTTEFNVTLEKAGGAESPSMEDVWLKGTI